MYKKFTCILSLCLLISIMANPVSAKGNANNDVEFILEMVSRTPGSEYAWNCDGGEEKKTESLGVVKMRVWGWSTCYDKEGKEAFHYTTSRYEDWFGFTREEWTSGRQWARGQVYAYSPFIDWRTADELKARVYYGL